jgi:tRNA(Ile)-lysidine synthase
MNQRSRSISVTVEARFLRALSALSPGEARVLVAVSGGLDSVVLLDLLAATRDRHHLDLVVAHADHGIHPESTLVAHEVEALAARLGLAYVSGSLRLAAGTSETRARAARYRWLRETRRTMAARWIVTAHQADDQRETVLMRLLRGSGPAGLAGMQPRERDLLRPLLGFSRRTLARCARRRGLRWWNDPANENPEHLRSWIRVHLLPALAARLPDIDRKLAETRRHARRDRQGWEQALRRWPGLAAEVSARECSVDWPVLRALPPALSGALIEALVRAAGGPSSPTRIRRALDALAGAPSGATAELGTGWKLERAFGRLRLSGPARSVGRAELVLDAPAGTVRWGEWEVRWSREPAPDRQPRDGSTAWFIPGRLALRPWRPGDRLAPLGGRGRRLVVRCFQDARVPRSERASWPMVEGEGDLAWIPGVCRSGHMVPEAGAPAVRLDVEPHG